MLRLDINLVFTIINLLIWYAIIRIFLFKPINKVIDKRSAAIQEKYDEAKKNSGSIQLHGHIHAHEEYNLQNKADGIRRYDVGVDANNYYPVLVKQIIEFFENNEGKCKL